MRPDTVKLGKFSQARRAFSSMAYWMFPSIIRFSDLRYVLGVWKFTQCLDVLHIQNTFFRIMEMSSRWWKSSTQFHRCLLWSKWQNLPVTLNVTQKIQMGAVPSGAYRYSWAVCFASGRTQTSYIIVSHSSLESKMVHTEGRQRAEDKMMNSKKENRRSKGLWDNQECKKITLEMHQHAGK